MRHRATCALLLALGCGAPPPPEPLPPPAPPPAPIASALPMVSASVAPSIAPSATAPSAAPPSEPPPTELGGPFPPPAASPIHARTAKPDDGRWEAMADGARDGRAVMYRTTLHPHPIKPHVYVTVIAFDRHALDLELVAGTLEPENAAIPKERRGGLVPSSALARLVAVFNGGFMAKHGKYGMRIGDDRYLPPRDDACAITRHPNGSLAIARWDMLAPHESRASWYRQTPPCLVEAGALNARLARERKWGGAEDGNREIRRSAVGLDEGGRALFYAFGDWIEPIDLGRVMVAAGAHWAAQLDINWSYTRFFLFERGGGTARIRETLIPKLEFSPGRYVEKPSERDFFYVIERR